MGGAWLTYQLPAVLAVADLACRAQLEGAPFSALTDAEALELEAIAAQIFPTDDSPGAREAGIIYFIDRAMTDLLDEDQALDIRNGVVEMQSAVAEAYPSAGRFSSLGEQEQIAYLKSIENTGFFYSIRSLTIAGMFAHPKYGGNRDKIGWRHLGYDDRHFWQPPFGYYDAEYSRGDVDDG